MAGLINIFTMMLTYANGVFVQSVCFVSLVLSGTCVHEADDHEQRTASRPPREQPPTTRKPDIQILVIQLHTICLCISGALSDPLLSDTVRIY